MDKEAIRKRIREFTLMDDVFMTRVFDGGGEAVQFALRIILQKKDLVVKSARAQDSRESPAGRSLCLEVCAEDGRGTAYDIEIRRDDRETHPKRARCYGAMIDSARLKSGEKGFKLPESYVIFITENDVLGAKRPIYHVERVVLEKKTYFRDGTHIVYVNGENRDMSTDLGKLMHDFHASKADDIISPVLAGPVRYYKEDEEGVEIMSGIAEKIWLDGEQNEKRQVISTMLRKNKTPDEIRELLDYPANLIYQVQSEMGQTVKEPASGV